MLGGIFCVLMLLQRNKLWRFDSIFDSNSNCRFAHHYLAVSHRGRMENKDYTFWCSTWCPNTAHTVPWELSTSLPPLHHWRRPHTLPQSIDRPMSIGSTPNCAFNFRPRRYAQEYIIGRLAGQAVIRSHVIATRPPHQCVRRDHVTNNGLRVKTLILFHNV